MAPPLLAIGPSCWVRHSWESRENKGQGLFTVSRAWGQRKGGRSRCPREVTSPLVHQKPIFAKSGQDPTEEQFSGKTPENKGVWEGSADARQLSE